MCCHAHYQCFTGSHLVVAYSAAVLLEHPNAVLLRLVYRPDSIAVAQQLHIEVGECLMCSIVMRTDIAVELAVIHIHKLLLELR